MAITTSAQEEHMKFMGISFNENIKTFISLLEDKGFTYFQDIDNTQIMKGKFAGYTDCTLFIYPTINSQIRAVAVDFPRTKQWSVLYGNYTHIKDMLSQKYGSPASCEEEFESIITPQNDRDKMHEVEMERCKYSTVYLTNTGSISVKITSVEMICSVSLLYSDTINMKINESSAIDDL